MRGLMPQQSRIVIGAVIDIAISAIVIAAGQVLHGLVPRPFRMLCEQRPHLRPDIGGQPSSMGSSSMASRAASTASLTRLFRVNRRGECFLELLRRPRISGGILKGKSWDPWRSVLIASRMDRTCCWLIGPFRNWIEKRSPTQASCAEYAPLSPEAHRKPALETFHRSLRDGDESKGVRGQGSWQITHHARPSARPMPQT